MHGRAAKQDCASSSHHAKIVTERGKFQKIMSEMKTIQMRRKEEVKWKQHSIKNVLE